MNEFKQYRRKGFSEMRPYVPGEDLSGVSISQADNPKEGDMIARNPNDHTDLWLVDQKWFEENFELVE